MSNFRILLLARDCDSSNILFNYLNDYFNIESVIIEEPASRFKQLQKRSRLIGFWNVLGQVFFMVLIVPFLKLGSGKRVKEILKKYNLSNKLIPSEKIRKVHSLNSNSARELIQQINPQLVIINGTRIISKKTLGSVTVPFINIHTGITPAFRGVHGGYWSIAIDKPEYFGTTIHFVDSGVDTGSIIEQVFIKPDKNDNFYAYPYLQQAAALPVLKKIIESFADGKPPAVKTAKTNESKLWFHPTIFQWIANLQRTSVFLLAVSFILF